MKEIGSSLISVLVMSRVGLVIDIITRDEEKEEEKKFIGAFSALVEVVLRKLTKDFDLGTFGAGTFDTDRYRFIFCESGAEYVLVSIFDNMTLVDAVFPYTYIAADKVARIFDDLPVSPVMPKLAKEKDIKVFKIKSENITKAKDFSFNYIYKLGLIGDSGVGKTSIVHRFVYDTFSDDYKSTIGTFIMKKECRFEDIDTNIRFSIWDLAGQTQFKRIWPEYLTDSNAGIIAFDVSNRKSFESVKMWYNEITRVASPGLVLILAGNKIDLKDERVITTEEAKALAKELNVHYIETSAKTNENLNDLFEWIALQIIEGRTMRSEDYKTLEEGDMKIEKDAQYYISEAQIKMLSHFFNKQLDYAIDEREKMTSLKFLQLIKKIRGNLL